jgi:hypothetical protein
MAAIVPSAGDQLKNCSTASVTALLLRAFPNREKFYDSYTYHWRTADRDYSARISGKSPPIMVETGQLGTCLGRIRNERQCVWQRQLAKWNVQERVLMFNETGAFTHKRWTRAGSTCISALRFCTSALTKGLGSGMARLHVHNVDGRNSVGPVDWERPYLPPIEGYSGGALGRQRIDPPSPNSHSSSATTRLEWRARPSRGAKWNDRGSFRWHRCAKLCPHIH